jgi:phage tail-like protein
MANPEKFYQAVGFHFLVEFSLKGAAAVDVRFQSVSGLDSTMDVETIKEGGENRFEHVIPTRRKFGPLVLKRGLLGPTTSGVTAWLKRTFDNNIPFTQFEVLDTVLIKLLGEDHQPLMYWTVNNVWPRSWKIGELNAERGEVLIETLELNYNRLVTQEIATMNPPTP